MYYILLYMIMYVVLQNFILIKQQLFVIQNKRNGYVCNNKVIQEQKMHCIS